MKKKGIILLVGILFLFSLTFISANTFGYNYLEDENSFFGNISFNGDCGSGGVQILEGGIICAQSLQVINISNLNVTYENVTVTDNLNVIGNLTASNFFGNFEGNSSIWSRAGTNTFLTNLGDKVGIGTMTPSYDLEILNINTFVALNVKTTNAGSDAYNILETNGGNAKYVYVDNGVNQWNFGYDGSDGDFSIHNYQLGTKALTIQDTTGNIGIGTTVPAHELVVKSATSPAFQLVSDTTGDLGSDGFTMGLFNDDAYIIQRENKSIFFRTNSSDAITIDNNQNLGIGTITPDAVLDVNGRIRGLSHVSTGLAPTSGAGFEIFYSSNAGTGFLTAVDRDSPIDLLPIRFTANTLDFWTGNDLGVDASRMIIDSNGNVGIGIGTISPQNKLNVVGDFNVTGIVYQGLTSKAYAQTDYHNETDPLTITLSVEDQYENITGLHLAYNNSVYMNGQATINKTAMYSLMGSVSFSGGNSGLYRFNLFINNLEEHACGSMRTTSTSKIGSISINCLVQLNKGDFVNMRIKDTTSPVQDVSIYTLTFDMVEL